MPPIDWIHVAMFIAGLALQYMTSRSAASPVVVPTSPVPATTADAKPLLDLVHKLLDQRQATPPQLDSQTVQAWMGLVSKLLNAPAAPSAKA